MFQYSGTIILHSNAPATIAELIVAAVKNRSYANAAAQGEDVSRLNPCVVDDGFIKPITADVLMLDSFKGTRNGAVVAGSGALAGGDFTASPGGGLILPAGDSRHFSKSTDLGTRVLYQSTGGDVAIEVDVKILGSS